MGYGNFSVKNCVELGEVLYTGELYELFIQACVTVLLTTDRIKGGGGCA